MLEFQVLSWDMHKKCGGIKPVYEISICIAVGDPNYRFIATVNNISIISWQLDLLVEKSVILQLLLTT
jgi:hypothetical protein